MKLTEASSRKKQLRAEISKSDVDVSLPAWAKAFAELQQWLRDRVGTWGAYQPLRDEAPIHELIRLTPEIDWVYPRIETDGSGRMSFWRPGPKGFKTGAFGLMQPAEDADLVDPSVLTGLVIPALAFDARGYRLGRGGGFYDRYLLGTKAIRLGIVPSNRIITEVPREDFDLPVDFLATEKVIFNTGISDN